MLRRAIALLVVLGACSDHADRAAGDTATDAAAPASSSGATGGASAAAAAGDENPGGATAGMGGATSPGQDAGMDASSDGVVDAGSDGSDAPASADAAPAGSVCAFSSAPTERTYLVDRVSVPAFQSVFGVPFTYDLNGDGEPDNAFGAASMHFGQSFAWQAAMDRLVSSGRLRLSIDLAAADPSFADAACAAFELSRGQSTQPDAGEAFVRDTRAGEITLAARIESGALEASLAAPSTPTDIELVLSMGPIVGAAAGDTWPGVTALRVTLVHASFAITDDALMQGELHGFISAAELRGVLIPALAENLNAIAAEISPQILATFDTGGTPDPACPGTCRDVDGGCAVAADAIISSCEVATSTSGQNVLVPDVQMLDADGGYAPNPANAAPDSYSIGLGFTAQRVTF